MKFSTNRVQVKIGKQVKKEEIALKLPATGDVHKGKEIEVFCQQCKVAICMMCFIKSHKTHDCSDVEKVSVGLRRQMTSDTGKVIELLKKTEKVFPPLTEKETPSSATYLASIEVEINTAASRQVDCCCLA